LRENYLFNLRLFFGSEVILENGFADTRDFWGIIEYDFGNTGG